MVLEPSHVQLLKTKKGFTCISVFLGDPIFLKPYPEKNTEKIKI